MNTADTQATDEIQVQFFAHLAEKFGEHRTVLLKPGSSTIDLMDLLSAMRPDVSGLLAVCRVATDERILSSGEALPHRVCVFPPMSGG